MRYTPYSPGKGDLTITNKSKYLQYEKKEHSYAGTARVRTPTYSDCCCPALSRLKVSSLVVFELQQCPDRVLIHKSTPHLTTASHIYLFMWYSQTQQRLSINSTYFSLWHPELRCPGCSITAWIKLAIFFALRRY